MGGRLAEAVGGPAAVRAAASDIAFDGSTHASARRPDLWQQRQPACAGRGTGRGGGATGSGAVSSISRRSSNQAVPLAVLP